MGAVVVDDGSVVVVEAIVRTTDRRPKARGANAVVLLQINAIKMYVVLSTFMTTAAQRPFARCEDWRLRWNTDAHWDGDTVIPEGVSKVRAHASKRNEKQE